MKHATGNEPSAPKPEYLTRYILRDGDNEYGIRFLSDTEDLREMLPDIGGDFNPATPEGQRCIEEALRMEREEGYFEIDDGLRAVTDIVSFPVPPEEAEIARKYLYW